MGSCAIGTCTDPNCHMCTVVAAGKVEYRTAWQRGFITVPMNAQRKSAVHDVRSSEHKLTSLQGKKVARQRKK